VTAGSGTGWRTPGRRIAGRLIRPGLPGALALLLVAATIAVFVPSRLADAARRGSWVTSWSASPQTALPRTLAAAGFARSSSLASAATWSASS
jgi:hypothetical protein